MENGSVNSHNSFKQCGFIIYEKLKRITGNSAIGGAGVKMELAT